jgi:cell division protein FtsB
VAKLVKSTKKTRIWASLRAAIGPAAGFLVIAFFGGYALFGANGALAWGDYSQRLHERKVELARIEAERARLAHRVALLDPRHANPDLVDELVRRELGVVGKDEIIVRLK